MSSGKVEIRLSSSIDRESVPVARLSPMVCRAWCKDKLETRWASSSPASLFQHEHRSKTARLLSVASDHPRPKIIQTTNDNDIRRFAKSNSRDPAQPHPFDASLSHLALCIRHMYLCTSVHNSFSRFRACCGLLSYMSKKGGARPLPSSKPRFDETIQPLSRCPIRRPYSTTCRDYCKSGGLYHFNQPKKLELLGCKIWLVHIPRDLHICNEYPEYPALQVMPPSLQLPIHSNSCNCHSSVYYYDEAYYNCNKIPNYSSANTRKNISSFPPWMFSARENHGAYAKVFSKWKQRSEIS